jgi:hypothetical protein
LRSSRLFTAQAQESYIVDLNGRSGGPQTMRSPVVADVHFHLT